MVASVVLFAVFLLHLFLSIFLSVGLAREIKSSTQHDRANN